METKTKVISGVALVVAAGMMLFPPERGGGYEFIFDASSVDGTKLLVQLGLLGVLASALNFMVGWVSQPESWGIIKKTARCAAFFSAGVIGLIVVIAAGKLAFEYATTQMPEKMLSISASYNPSYCTDENPMRVAVSNKWFGEFKGGVAFSIKIHDKSGKKILASWQGSLEDLASVKNFNLKEAMKSGYSSQAIKDHLLADLQYTWEDEIPAWHNARTCYAYPNSLVLQNHDPRDLKYTAVIHETYANYFDRYDDPM